MIKARTAFAGLVALSLSMVLSCKDENPLTDESPSTVVFDLSDVRYGRDVQTLFNQACNFSACHSDGEHQSNLRLTSHWNTVYALGGVVTPGDPANSTLVTRIEGWTFGPRMPLNGTPLNKNQTDGIRTWVLQGAKNN